MGKMLNIKIKNIEIIRKIIINIEDNDCVTDDDSHKQRKKLLKQSYIK